MDALWWTQKKQCPGSGLFEQHTAQLGTPCHHIAFMFNFEVLNLEVDCKEAEQKLLELLLTARPWAERGS